MLFKSTKHIRFAAPAFALLTLTGLYAASSYYSQPNSSSKITEKPVGMYNASVKWRYDEMAHKLVMEYGHQTCEQLNNELATSLGSALRNVSRQITEQRKVIEL